MPSYTPEQVNTLFLAIFFLIVMGGTSVFVRAVWIFWRPLQKRRMEADASKAEADAALASSLVVTTVKLSVSLERLVDISQDQTVTLNVHGQILNLHGEQIRAIARTINAPIVGPGSEPRGPMTFQPAVEVDSSGKPHSVTVVTETLRNPGSERPGSPHQCGRSGDVGCSLISDPASCPLIFSSPRMAELRPAIGFH